MLVSLVVEKSVEIRPTDHDRPYRLQIVNCILYKEFGCLSLGVVVCVRNLDEAEMYEQRCR